MVSDVHQLRRGSSLLRSLNPCSNGIWSLTLIAAICSSDIVGLNPCSNGIWSLTDEGNGNTVVLTHSLNPCSNGIWSLTAICSSDIVARSLGLNPCSNGIWSLTYVCNLLAWAVKVLILVLMEYGLWQRSRDQGRAYPGLNPCSNGIWSLTIYHIIL